MFDYIANRFLRNSSQPTHPMSPHTCMFVGMDAMWWGRSGVGSRCWL